MSEHVTNENLGLFLASRHNAGIPNADFFLQLHHVGLEVALHRSHPALLVREAINVVRSTRVQASAGGIRPFGGWWLPGGGGGAGGGAGGGRAMGDHGVGGLELEWSARVMSDGCGERECVELRILAK